MRKTEKLRRLAALTELIHRSEAASAASLARSHQALLDEAGNAHAFIDEENDQPSFLRALALARAVRMRQNAEMKERELATQLAIAVQTLAQSKGAKALVESSVEENARVEAQQALEEVIGRSGAYEKSRASNED